MAAVRPKRLPSLRAILAFEATARNLTISQAAEELNLTTSAVSHSLAGLEDQIGAKLFRRMRNGVALTLEGANILTEVRAALGHLDAAFAPAPPSRQTRLCISILPSFASRWLLPRLASLRAAMPEVLFDIRIGDDLVVFDVERSVDVGIRFGRGDWPGTDSMKLMDERVFPVASPNFRGGRLPRKFEDLLDGGLLSNPHQPWGPWFDRAGIPWSDDLVTLELADSALIVQAAAEGLGIGLARGQLVEPDILLGRLTPLYELDLSTDYSYWVVWPKGTRKRALVDRLCDWLRDQARDCGRAPRPAAALEAAE